MSSVDLDKLIKAKKPAGSAIKKESVIQKLNDLLSKDIQVGFSGSIDDKFKEAFYAELSLLISEGIDIKSAFNILVEETEKPKIAEQLSEIRKRIINGEK